MIKGHLVTVLGREIPVRSAASEEKVREIEAFIHRQIEAVKGCITTADPQLLISLALLNISEQYLDQKREQEEGRQLVKRLSGMLQRLDGSL